MRKLIVFVLLLTLGCASTSLDGVSTEGLTHEGETVYYNGQPAAFLQSVELSYDDGKIVKELTFILTSAEYNGIALNIIHFVREHNPNVEVEVELKRY